MTAPEHPRAPRRRAPHRIGPAVLQLVQTLRATADSVDIRLDARTAAAIARLDAREMNPTAPGAPSPWDAVARSIAVDRETATRWHAFAWQAAGEGLIAPAAAQALSDQLQPRGAA